MRPTRQGPAPLILSYAFAQSRFGGDAAALGRELLVNGQPARVVGVMPRDFRFLNMSPPFEIIVALRLDPARLAISGLGGMHALARLKPGVTPVEASADLQRMSPLWLDAWPIAQGSSVTREAIANWRVTPVVQPLKDDIVGDVASALWVLMGAIGAVLLVACANIANLMLVRADARRPELAVRAALGAVPARIARELLVESLVIGAIGGALGLVLAYGGLELLVAVGPSNLPRLEEIAVHAPVLAFTVAVSLVSTLAFGSITAFKHARNADMSAFGGVPRLEREPRAQHDAQRARRRAGGARARARRERGAHDPNVSGVARRRSGVRRRRPRSKPCGRGRRTTSYATRGRFVPLQHEILDAIAALPGVDAVGFTSVLPMEGAPFVNTAPVFVEEPAGRPPERRPRRAETSSSRRATSKRWARGSSRGATSRGPTSKPAAASPSSRRSSLATSAQTPAARSANAFDRPSTATTGARSSASCRASRKTRCTREAPSIVYWPALMENAFGNAASGCADHVVRGSQRPHGHRGASTTRSAKPSGR